MRIGRQNLRILRVGGLEAEELDFDGKLAMDVHPKYVGELTMERFLTLQQILRTPEVAAIDEIDLERIVPVRRGDVARVCRKQDEVFRKVFGLTRPDQPIILHFRGPFGDRIGADVHVRALQILRKVCPFRQMIHLHCFTGDNPREDAGGLSREYVLRISSVS